MRLYAATSNPGKLRDLAYAAEGHLLHGLPVAIEPLPSLASLQPPPEDEPTFLGNARTKALFYAAHAAGLLVLADDSGLEVDALDGAPGVRSARYADDHAFALHTGARTDDRNNELLLSKLLWTSAWAPRTARYRCALALATLNPGQGQPHILATAEGVLEGEIVHAPHGSLGFGYDPLFLIPQLNRTMAELDPTTRLSFSHRGRALKALLASRTTFGTVEFH